MGNADVAQTPLRKTGVSYMGNPPSPSSASVDDGGGRRARGCSCVQVALAAFVILVGAAIAFPYFTRGNLRQHSPGAACQHNLKQITFALMVYAEDCAGLTCPESLWTDRLLPYTKNPWLYGCSSAPKLPVGYAYGQHIAGRRLAALKQPETVLAFWDAEPGVQTFAFRHLDGLNVAYADGHVKRRSAEELHSTLVKAYGKTIEVEGSSAR